MDCSNILSIFALDSVSLQGREGQDILVKRTFTNVIFEVPNLANLNSLRRNATETSTLGVLYPIYNNSRRGLTRVAYPKREAMREPGTWDKRKVVTPTSFIYNLKLLAETWEVIRRQLADEKE